MDVVSDIKSRISIEELVAGYVQLQKAGRHFKGLCPFHNEKTPSFFVSPEKQLAYCFGCHRGGDVFKFIQEIEKIEFPEALKMLAERAGVELPKQFEVKEKGKRQRFLHMHEIAKDWFKKNLWETQEGEKVLSYIRKKRKLSDETIRKFELGFAPNGKGLVDELVKQGFSGEEMTEAGLAGALRVSGTEMHDRFTDRWMFPIYDGQGQVVAFGGRALRDGQEPKYLNSAETLLYRKGSLLYGMHAAKESFRKDNKALIVEGYMDVLRCHESGFQNAVGVCGTALTSEQLRNVKRYTSSVVFFFDGDEAGKLATFRAFPIASSEGLFISVVRPPADQDPDTWLLDDPKNAEEGLLHSSDFFEFLFSELQKTHDFQNPQEKQKALTEIFPFLLQVRGRIEQDAYVQRLATFFKVPSAHVYDEVSRMKNVPFQAKETFSVKASRFSTEEYLIGCFLQFPETWEVAKKLLSGEIFSGEQNRLYKILEDVYNRIPIGVVNIPSELQEKAAFLAFFAETQNATLSYEEIFEEVQKVTEKLRREKNEEQKIAVKQKIQEAEGKRDHRALQELLGTYQALIGKN